MKLLLQATVILSYLINAAGAPINFQNLTSTNVVKTNDALIINSSFGGGVWSTRQASKQALWGDPFKVTSLLEDNATNVAMVVDTGDVWTGGRLMSLRNDSGEKGGTLFFGGRYVGDFALIESLRGPFAPGDDFISYGSGDIDGVATRTLELHSLVDTNFTTDASAQLKASTNGTASLILSGYHTIGTTWSILSDGKASTSFSYGSAFEVTPAITAAAVSQAYKLGTDNAITNTIARIVRFANGPTEIGSIGIDGRIITQAGTAITPSAANATGTAGTILWDSGFIYVCVAPSTWKRVAIATW